MNLFVREQERLQDGSNNMPSSHAQRTTQNAKKPNARSVPAVEEAARRRVGAAPGALV
jgi:hypothetical protein